MIDGRQRKNIKIGLFVEVIQKPHQLFGQLTSGKVAKILTKSPSHPYGIKIKIESGIVGRVKNIVD